MFTPAEISTFKGWFLREVEKLTNLHPAHEDFQYQKQKVDALVTVAYAMGSLAPLKD